MREVVNLDFLRSVAVLLVVRSHWLIYSGRRSSDWSGITGVCMFFVHTSLVLMWSLERDSQVGHFYLRRAFRIYPLWLVVLAMVLLFHLPNSPSFHFRMPGAQEILFNAALVCNYRFGPGLVGASWTLPLEMQMYLFLPFLFFFARSTRLVWPLIAIDALIMVYDRVNFPSFYSALPMCIPYFIPGVIAYVLSKRHQLRKIPGWAFPLWLAFLVIVDQYGGSFRRSWFFCLALGLSLPLFHDIASKPVQMACHYVAKYSYGIYLTHVTALVIGLHTLRDHSALVRVLGATAIFVGLPVLFYHLVEAPAIRLGARLAQRLDGRKVPRMAGRAMEMEPAP